VALTGFYSFTTRIPYISVSSISVAGKYYWAKSFNYNPGDTITGVQFSSDGALLIAHSTNLYFIVTIDVISGRVLSARTYSQNGYYISEKCKSMQISSGPSPMAYVLSST
jgi:hypothetical protein